uniref:Uncharacterized protein n=1 Tax=Eutreptiella gymnastica TaxID=73025 RepID=A0A7S1IDJ4_9EUGL|mmetsp:Transcript_149530/g.261298  ORF Transcript_149530/g.261298 Transcript_149530/m.261298 type:complete len:141 (+) Transcript_149530:241-663(+)
MIPYLSAEPTFRPLPCPISTDSLVPKFSAPAHVICLRRQTWPSSAPHQERSKTHRLQVAGTNTMALVAIRQACVHWLQYGTLGSPEHDPVWHCYAMPPRHPPLHPSKNNFSTFGPLQKFRRLGHRRTKCVQLPLAQVLKT